MSLLRRRACSRVERPGNSDCISVRPKRSSPGSPVLVANPLEILTLSFRQHAFKNSRVGGLFFRFVSMASFNIFSTTGYAERLRRHVLWI